MHPHQKRSRLSRPARRRTAARLQVEPLEQRVLLESTGQLVGLAAVTGPQADAPMQPADLYGAASGSLAHDPGRADGSSVPAQRAARYDRASGQPRRLPAAAILAAFGRRAAFTVNDTGDEPDGDPTDGICDTGSQQDGLTGLCTFRAAVEQSNNSPGADQIVFDIGPGTPTILITSALPLLVLEPVSIRGNTGGASRVELRGAAPGASGLTLVAGSSVIRNLVLNEFAGTALTIIGGGGNRIEGNYIGTDPAGKQSRGNDGHGILITGGSKNNTIGGTTRAARNVISGNDLFGVALVGDGVESNQVLGNYIGTDLSGKLALGNGSGGVLIDGASNNTIGGQRDSVTGPCRSPCNVISGAFLGGHDRGDGVRIGDQLGPASGNKVEGNFIGTDVTGTADLGNARDGVRVLRSDNHIGGALKPSGNLIAFNKSNGVTVAGSDTAGVAIRSNSIFSNGKLGIDLADDGVTRNDAGDADAGPNRLQNFPVITSVTGGSTVIKGTLNSTPNTLFRIDLFSNPAPDPSGFNEGQTFLAFVGAVTDAAGKASFELTVDDRVQNVTATATNLATGDTSEFSTGFGALVVNSVGDKGDVDSGDGLCNTGGTIVRNGTSEPECTLRAAIEEANAFPGTETISFNIPGPGVPAIRPKRQLPLVSGPVVLDGSSQPGSGKVELDGSRAGPANGLFIWSGDSVVKGLVINRFQGHGIVLVLRGGNVIKGNFIGTDVSGRRDLGNKRAGIFIWRSAGNTIGAARPWPGRLGRLPGNIISANDGHGVWIRGRRATGNRVIGNRIGTDVGGKAELGNGRNGVLIENAGDNTVGSESILEINQISGNHRHGVEIRGQQAANNKVQGNIIGTDRTGTSDLGNKGSGVLVNGAAQNLIGGEGGNSGAPPGNLIAGNDGHGVEIRGPNAQGNKVQGNRVGAQIGSVEVDPDDTAALPNSGNGIFINNAPVNLVGGTSVMLGNLISANQQHGVLIKGKGARKNVVQGNRIGTTAGGGRPLGNSGNGVLIYSAARNTIGGSELLAGNLISGNQQNGVELRGRGAHHNTVLGNYIGTESNHRRRLPNRQSGVLIKQAANNTIGGTDRDLQPCNHACNLISGNDGSGIHIQGAGATGNTVLGNYIGTDSLSRTAVHNSGGGVLIDGAPNNLIGGLAYEAANVISGNRKFGIKIRAKAASGNTVQGNYIGTNASGDRRRPNRGPGVVISNAPANAIGGPSDRAANLISGNSQSNVLITGREARGNKVRNNLIGTDANGTRTVGNDGPGVTINNAPGNLIGGPGSRAGNLISGNWQSNVLITGRAARNNKVQGNYIGVNRAGTDELDHTSTGVLIVGASQNLIGGTARTTPLGPCTGACNVISGHDQYGIEMRVGPGKKNYPSKNRVVGNYIGTDQSGTAAIGNSSGGVSIVDGPNNTVGGLRPNAGNVIAASGTGVTIHGGRAWRNTVVGNFIGTDTTGRVTDPDGQPGSGDELGNPKGGILVFDAMGTTIGGTSPAARNIIAGNARFGVHIKQVDESTARSVVQGNYIGTSVTGRSALPNKVGVLVTGKGSAYITIGGARSSAVGKPCTGPCNLISGNSQAGVKIANTDGDAPVAHVAGNYIGTDPTGLNKLPNKVGVLVINGANSRIGGSSPKQGNIISGNTSHGVHIIGTGAHDNWLQHNFIGTDAKGTGRLANKGHGVFIEGAPNNRIGQVDDDLKPSNVISGNEWWGVAIAGPEASNNQVLGNFIGTDRTGAVTDPDGQPRSGDELGNLAGGVEIEDAPSNVVGGSQNTEPAKFCAGSCNLISGNGPGLGGSGIEIAGSSARGNRIEGNFIGTDLWGTAPLGNAGFGVWIIGGPRNTIGGRKPAARNLISANGADAIFIADASLNRVWGNVIGTKADGITPLKNNGDGVSLDDGAHLNVIGKDAKGGGRENTIAYNAGDGVSVSGQKSIRNLILSNVIFENEGLGIDLGPDGVTPNDSGDKDTGPNMIQNYPLLKSASASRNKVTIKGEIRGPYKIKLTLQFFTIDACDPSGHGEGESFLASAVVTPGKLNFARFTLNPPVAVKPGKYLAATSTELTPTLNGIFGNTSEFSNCVAVQTDRDGDGVPNDVENRAPGGRDSDGNGLPDSRQPNLASVPNARDGRYLTLLSPEGSALAGLGAVASPTPAGPPRGPTFPVGFIEFMTPAATPGAATTVTMLLPPGLAVDSYYQYGPTAENPRPHWYEFLFDGHTGAEILTDRLILHLADGRRGDDDLTANGQIVHTGGPALQSRAAPAACGGNVTAQISSGRLTVSGDQADNCLLLDQLRPRAFRLSGLHGTTVNAQQTPVSFNGVAERDVSVWTGDGNDQLWVNRSLRRMRLGSLSVRTGRGADTVVVDPVTITGRTAIQTGAGADVIELLDARLAGPATLASAGGDDRLTIRNVRFAGPVSLTTGDGSDVLSIDDSTFSSRVSVATGDGPDRVAIERAGSATGLPTTFIASASLCTGAGDDLIELGRPGRAGNTARFVVLPSVRGPALLIDGGQGADRLAAPKLLPLWQHTNLLARFPLLVSLERMLVL